MDGQNFQNVSMKTDFKRNFFGGGVKAGKKKIQRILGKIEISTTLMTEKISIFVRHFAWFITRFQNLYSSSSSSSYKAK